MKNFKELVRKDTSDIFSYSQEVYDKRRKMERDFEQKWKNVIFKIGFDYYTGLHVCIKQSGDYELYAQPVLDAIGTTGKVKEIKYFDFEKAEIATLDELEDTSFNVEGKTLTNFKEYLEHVGYDTKKVHGIVGTMGFQYFNFEIVDKTIEIKICRVRNKGNANKFNTMYNLMKRMGAENYVITKLSYRDYDWEPYVEMNRISYDKLRDMLNFSK